MLFEKKKDGTLLLVPEKTLARLRAWKHREIFPGQSPIAILKEVLANGGREAYEVACRELLDAMRVRFNIRKGFHSQFGFYSDPKNGTMLSVSPSPRPGQDYINEDGGPLHPIPIKEQHAN